ncbi:MAG TPA: lytic murein transglycosylase, partial [Solirubrobacterales bacterium]|nr:lytic murein transglycosylase [Solirubrobacterales bacterium]
MTDNARKIRTLVVTATATVALSLPVALTSAQAATEPTPGDSIEQPKEGPLEQGATLAPPSSEDSEPVHNGGTNAEDGTPEPDPDEGEEDVETPSPDEADTEASPDPSGAFTVPAFPTSSCASTGVPPVLIPIYQRAAARYELGPQGPAVLAGINEIETGFGQNLGPSYAGAVGWMQFMPETWAAYGVDADGDGDRDPNDPEDAIFSAAYYLSASGMPEDTYGAIFAYNHADWYVADVLANAACFAQEVGGPGFGPGSLMPQ